MKRAFLLLILLWLIPAQVFSQASPNVSVLDSLYQDMDYLVGLGLIDEIIVGQRPYSQREIVWLGQQAEKKINQLRQGTVDKRLKKRIKRAERLIARIKRRFPVLWQEDGKNLKKIVLSPLSELRFNFFRVDSPARDFENNGLGELDAFLNPLAQGLEGRRIIDGKNLGLELQHGFRLSPYFYLQAEERFQLAWGPEGEPENHDVYVQKLVGSFWVKNLEIRVGRDQILWGQSPKSGLLISANARPLDHVQVSNDIPFKFPWVFKALGPTKLSFFFADLGPEQFFPHSKLVGTKLSFQPFRFFEFGFSSMTLFGGEGAPEASLATRFKDVFPLVQLFTGAQAQVDNKIGGADFRFRFKKLRGTEFYLEVIFDDTPGNDQKKFWIQDAGHVVGSYLPRIFDDATLSLRLEYRRTGIRFYRHPQFQSGWSLNRLILGDNLGPDAQGIYMTLDYVPFYEHRLRFITAWERRSQDLYTGSSDNGLIFIKLENRPKESRVRLGVDWKYEPEDFPLRLNVAAAYERLWNFAFNPGQGLNNWAVGINLDFFFRPIGWRN